MAASFEDVRKLFADGKPDDAGKIARENWNELSHIDRGYREQTYSSIKPNDNSLAWVACLHSELEQRLDCDWPTLLQRMSVFVEDFSVEQIEQFPGPFCELFHRLTDLLCHNKRAIQGISLVRDAVRRYSPDPTTLTALHSDLVQLCLAARCIKPCLPFIEKHYTNLLCQHQQFESQYVVQFFYYGGMAYTALHDYLGALQMFTMCLSVPAMAMSAVMLAAYKKYILVSLLKYGKLITLPRCASQFVERVFKGPCGIYLELARAYASHNYAGVTKVTNSPEVFVTDGNLGLIRRLEGQLIRHSVQRLTLSFLTIPLTDAAGRVNCPSALEMEKQIRDMIDDDEVNARLSQGEGMVMFGEEQEKEERVAAIRLAHLQEQLEECMHLQKNLSLANQQLAVDQRYIQKSVKGFGIDDDPLAEDHLM